ncbi:hypothetical protein TeGR_g14900, partial [Tetraparma gracilis]
MVPALFGSIVSAGAPKENRDFMGMLSDESDGGALAAEEEPIRVRFRNVPGVPGDVVVQSRVGVNLLALGDANEVKIPRACRTGLCGTCTADLVDPSWPGGGDAGGAPGLQAIRCCSAKTVLPLGMDEMIIDLSRGSESSGEPVSNPMARFDDGWENDY